MMQLQAQDQFIMFHIHQHAVMKLLLRRSCSENSYDLYACQENNAACDTCVFCYFDSSMTGPNGKCMSKEFVNSTYCIFTKELENNETIIENICCPYPVYCNVTSLATILKPFIFGVIAIIFLIIFK